jgi:hypothetical protein
MEKLFKDLRGVFLSIKTTIQVNDPLKFKG